MILDAAFQTIVDRATTDITIDEVATAAGVDRTTVYRRWSTAGDLVKTVVATRAAASLPIPETGELRSDLILLGRRIRATVSSPLGRALFGPGRASDPDLEPIRDAFWRQRFDDAATIIDAAVKREDCPRPVDTEQVIEYLVGPITFRLSERRRPYDDLDLERLADVVLDALDAVPAAR